MSSPPALTLYRTDCELFLETDASDRSVGAVLKLKSPNGEIGVIAYASRSLNDAQRRYCTTMRELLAIIFGLTHFRHYLLGRTFSAFSDHNALQYFSRGKCLTPQIARYLDFIALYDMRLSYKLVSHWN